MKELIKYGIDPDETSNVYDTTSLDVQGLARRYPLRIHKVPSEAERGTEMCREDWASYVGPVEEWGNSCPQIADLCALMFPLVKPERLALCAYLFEAGFLYDERVESHGTTTTGIINQRAKQSDAGLKKIMSKAQLELMKIDPVCAVAVMQPWNDMLSCAFDRFKRKDQEFKNLDEYIDFRVIDAGCIWTGAILLFGMATTLSNEEKETAHDMLTPNWAALVLENDYFSFNAENRDTSKSSEKAMMNSISLTMQWENVDEAIAKHKVQKRIIALEEEFLKAREQYLRNADQYSPEMLRYLEAWFYVIPANVYWSTYCPRYNAERPKLGQIRME
ncbi:hypothetical protein TWF694_005811 [Orbilia ellipsospora]|uniref:Terpene synthase n=1 Tax=Orbilia ellipsospora TaxID=2528407 RepID=A0AAV9WS11_9PEZI